VEATRQIRATGAGRDLPIIISSASVFHDERPNVLGTGANEFIAKPFREAEIWTALERYLGPIFLRQPLAAAARRESFVPTRDEVRALGAEIVDEVRDAVELGYVSRVPSILGRADDRHGQTVTALLQLATRLELDSLRKLL